MVFRALFLENAFFFWCIIFFLKKKNTLFIQIHDEWNIVTFHRFFSFKKWKEEFYMAGQNLVQKFISTFSYPEIAPEIKKNSHELEFFFRNLFSLQNEKRAWNSIISTWSIDWPVLDPIIGFNETEREVIWWRYFVSVSHFVRKKGFGKKISSSWEIFFFRVQFLNKKSSAKTADY